MALKRKWIWASRVHSFQLTLWREARSKLSQVFTVHTDMTRDGYVVPCGLVVLVKEAAVEEGRNAFFLCLLSHTQVGLACSRTQHPCGLHVFIMMLIGI